jgi:hypothetical protein
MKKWLINCIIEQQIEVEAETLDNALDKVTIEDVELDILLAGAKNFQFVPEHGQGDFNVGR